MLLMPAISPPGSRNIHYCVWAVLCGCLSILRRGFIESFKNLVPWAIKHQKTSMFTGVSAVWRIQDGERKGKLQGRGKEICAVENRRHSAETLLHDVSFANGGTNQS
jgi:hypothetical protein